DVRNLRSEVGHFDDRVRGQLALDRHVPLLHVARAERPVHGEDALSEAGGWRRTDWCDGWSLRQHEGRCDVVERSLRYVLQERKVRRRERRRDPRHLNPNPPVPRAEDCLVRQAVDSADARAKVVLLERAYRLRTWIVELPRLDIE